MKDADKIAEGFAGIAGRQAAPTLLGFMVGVSLCRDYQGDCEEALQALMDHKKDNTDSSFSEGAGHLLDEVLEEFKAVITA